MCNVHSSVVLDLLAQRSSLIFEYIEFMNCINVGWRKEMIRISLQKVESL